MSLKNSYAKVAVVEIQAAKSISIESISITKDECVLSGAWSFQLSERETVLTIIADRLLIVLGDLNAFKKYISEPRLVYIDAISFLLEAKSAAQEAMTAYEVFKANNIKRKNMVAPDFYDWPKTIDFNNAAVFLESKGRIATPASTPIEMKKTLAASNLVKYLVDRWHSDEQERNNRKYIEGVEAEITIIPKSWLELSEKS